MLKMKTTRQCLIRGGFLWSFYKEKAYLDYVDLRISGYICIAGVIIMCRKRL